MPELPEVETVRRGLQPVMEGARFVKVEAHRGDLRWPLPKDFAAAARRQDVVGLGRRAKYLLADLSSGDVLMMHLGMSGSFRVASRKRRKTPGGYSTTSARSSRARPRGVPHVDGRAHHLQRPAALRLMKLVPRAELDQEPLLRALGPEPLGNEFDAAMLARACTGKKTSLKAALSDQRSWPGSATSMSARRCTARGCRPSGGPPRSPRSPASPTSARRRWSMPSRPCSTTPIEAGGSSLRDHRRTDGELGDFQHNFRVYDREGKPCPTPGCRGTIRRIVQTGRSTFFCPVCQK